MDTELRTFDLVVLVLYMIGVFGLGCWFSRKSRSTQEFMAAGRSLPGWAVGLSIFGTYVSSIGFLGNTGKAYGSNWNFWVFGLSLPLTALIAVRYFIPLYRRSDAISAYAQLENRFGPWARTYALICYLLAQLARIGTILYLVALALAPLTGWDVRTIILVTGILVTVYTLLGGIEAVIWTDVAQSFVLVAGAFLCAGILLFSMPEGPGQIFEIAAQDAKFSLGSFSLAPSSLTWPAPSFWMVLVYGIFINLQNFGIDQSFVQRYITAESEEAAKFSVWLSAILFPIVSALFFFIGTSLYSYYATNAEFLDEVKTQVARNELIQNGDIVTDVAIAEAAADLKPADIGDKVLPHFIVRKLPVGVAGLLIAAIFAAAMSSMDTSLNSSASLMLCDVYQRYLRPDVGERESMMVLYGSTLLFGIIGTVTALAMIRVKSALDMWWDLQGIFTGGMLGLFLLGLISKRAKNPQAVTAVVAGVLVILWLSLSPSDPGEVNRFWPAALGEWANPLHSLMTIVVGTSSIVLLGVLLSQFLPTATPSESARAGGD